MVTPTFRSTDHGPATPFRIHGRVDFELCPPLLSTLAVGPFNQELVTALGKLAFEVYREMSASGPWMELVRFEESALAAPEVLRSFGSVLVQLAAQGLGPKAVAYVLDPEVEGTLLMAPLFAQSFAGAGILFAHFPSEPEARAWLEAQA